MSWPDVFVWSIGGCIVLGVVASVVGILRERAERRREQRAFDAKWDALQKRAEEDVARSRGT